MQHFYTHIIDLRDVHSELEILDLSDDEKNHLILVIESSIHHVIIDTLLTELPDAHKRMFLHHLAHNDHESIWDLLRKGLHKPEEKIKEAVQKLKTDFLEDIRGVKAS